MVQVIVAVAFLAVIIMAAFQGVRCKQGDIGTGTWWNPEPLESGQFAHYFGNLLDYYRTVLVQASSSPPLDSFTGIGSDASRKLQDAFVVRVQQISQQQSGVSQQYTPMVGLSTVALSDDTGRCEIEITSSPAQGVKLTMGDHPSIVSYMRGTCPQSTMNIPLSTVQKGTATPSNIVYVDSLEDLATFRAFSLAGVNDLPLGIRVIVVFVDPTEVRTHPGQYLTPSRSERLQQLVVFVSRDFKKSFVPPTVGAAMSVVVGPKSPFVTSGVPVTARTVCMCPRDEITGRCENRQQQTVLAARSDSLAVAGDQLADLAFLTQMANTLPASDTTAARRTTLCVFEGGSVWRNVQSADLLAKDVIILFQTGERNGIPVLLTSRGGFTDQAGMLPSGVASMFSTGYLNLAFPMTGKSPWMVSSYLTDRTVNTTEATFAYAVPNMRSHPDEPINAITHPSAFSASSMIANIPLVEWLIMISSFEDQGLDAATFP